MILAGRILTVIGTVVLVLALVGGGLAATSGFHDVARSMKAQTSVDPRASVTLREGEGYLLFHRPQSLEPTCRVTSPSGETVNMHLDESTSYGSGSSEWQSFAGWTASTAGRYEIECVGSRAMAAPDALAGSIVRGVLGTLTLAFAGGLGLVLTVAGIALWVLGRGRENERARLGMRG